MILGHKVALGPILPTDFALLFQWADDLDDARLNEPYRPPSWQRQEHYWLNAENDPSRVLFAIRSRPEAGFIGYVQIRDIHPVHRSATIGLRIGVVAERGRGRGREALALAVDYCWRQLNLTRLALSVFSDNAAALALYRTEGFREEGVMERALFIDGRWIDLVLMARLHDSRH